MPTTTPEQMDYTLDQMVDMFANRRFFNGFTGESCGYCKATTNVVALNAGWFCPCGHYNCQSWSHTMMPHVVPTYGPPSRRIRWAVKRVNFQENRDVN